MKTNAQRLKALGNTETINNYILQKGVTEFSPWTPLPAPQPQDWQYARND